MTEHALLFVLGIALGLALGWWVEAKVGDYMA